MNKAGIIVLLLMITGIAQAEPTSAKPTSVKPTSVKPAFTGQDYSGIYDCTGDDAHEGKYTGKVTLKLKPEHSHGPYASYDFKLEVPGYGTYLGHAAANDDKLAMHFALTDPESKDFGTGIATMKKNEQGKLSFHKFYYEPEYKGGNTGTEDCVKSN